MSHTKHWSAALDASPLAELRQATDAERRANAEALQCGLEATLPLTPKRLTPLCELGDVMRYASMRRREADRAAAAAGCILI